VQNNYKREEKEPGVDIRGLKSETEPYF